MPLSLGGLRVGLLVALGIGLAGPAHAQWRQIDGPRPPVVGAMGQIGDVLVLATDEADQGGTWRSDNGGTRWTHTQFVHGGGTAFLTAGTVLFQGTYLGGLWRSDDTGHAWRVVPDVPASATVVALETAGDTLYAALTDGALAPVARSFDAGATWTLGHDGTIGRPEAVLARPGGVVLLAMGGNGLFRSTDAGLSWTVPTGLPTNARISALAEDGPLVYAIVGASPAQNGLWRSTDDGASWALVGPFPVGEAEALLVDGPTVVAALGSQGVLRSTDDGQTWASPDGLPPTLNARTLLDAGGALWLGSDRGAFRSLDGGATWARTDRGAVGMSTLSALLAEGDGLWQALSEGPSDVVGLWHSADGGATWSHRSEGLPEGGRIVGLLRHRGALFALAAAPPRGVYRSDDGGDSWTRTSLAPGSASGFVALAADGDDRLFATTTTRTMFVSSDGGATWEARMSPLWLSDIVRWGDQLLGASYGEGTWRSADDGLTWMPFGTGLPSPTYATTFAVHEGALYLGTHIRGAYRLDGETWTALGPNGAYVEAFVSAPSGLVAVGHRTANGATVRQLRDGAWVALDEGLPEGLATHVVLRGDSVLVAGRQFGLWTRALRGAVAAESLPEPPARLAVWPNPARAGMTLTLSATGPVVVTDALGRAVARIDAGTWRLPVSITPGVYAVQAGRRVTRLVVVR